MNCLHLAGNHPFKTYAIQLLNLLVSNDLYNDAIDNVRIPTSSGTNIIESDDKKQIDNSRLRTKPSVSTSPQRYKKEVNGIIKAEAVAKTEQLCQEVITMMLDVAMGDDEYCQIFHFLLRTFSSSFAKKNGKESNNIRSDDSISQMNLLQSAH
mmetsp:Transcript_3963/g.5405  ORF Transcript_3963/g.5405 Transcript_3963/m.5405 type:complete len:153 (-) Transcript_3963:81-539(-)